MTGFDRGCRDGRCQDGRAMGTTHMFRRATAFAPTPEDVSIGPGPGTAAALPRLGVFRCGATVLGVTVAGVLRHGNSRGSHGPSWTSLSAKVRTTPRLASTRRSGRGPFRAMLERKRMELPESFLPFLLLVRRALSHRGRASRNSGALSQFGKSRIDNVVIRVYQGRVASQKKR